MVRGFAGPARCYRQIKNKHGGAGAFVDCFDGYWRARRCSGLSLPPIRVCPGRVEVLRAHLEVPRGRTNVLQGPAEVRGGAAEV